MLTPLVFKILANWFEEIFLIEGRPICGVAKNPINIGGGIVDTNYSILMPTGENQGISVLVIVDRVIMEPIIFGPIFAFTIVFFENLL